MSDIKTLIENGKNEEAIAIPEATLEPEELFLRVSALLALSQAKEAMDVLFRHRDALYALNPELTLKATFETRFILGQYDEAEEDLKHFENLPYVSQAVEEILRELPKTIAASRFAKKGSGVDLEEILQVLASPSDDMVLLSALNALKKVGELEDYRGLVEELLVGPCHDDVKTYALMLLSAKGSTHEVTLVKGGKTFTVVPNQLGSPYQTKEYLAARKSIESLTDASLAEVCGELLDLYALICYPARFVAETELPAFTKGLIGLGHRYLGQEPGPLSEEASRYADLVGKAIEENPPLFR